MCSIVFYTCAHLEFNFFYYDDFNEPHFATKQGSKGKENVASDWQHSLYLCCPVLSQNISV